jgi:hypothetical protein
MIGLSEYIAKKRMQQNDTNDKGDDTDSDDEDKLDKLDQPSQSQDADVNMESSMNANSDEEKINMLLTKLTTKYLQNANQIPVFVAIDHQQKIFSPSEAYMHYGFFTIPSEYYQTVKEVLQDFNYTEK